MCVWGGGGRGGRGRWGGGERKVGGREGEGKKRGEEKGGGGGDEEKGEEADKVRGKVGLCLRKEEGNEKKTHLS